VSRHPKVPGTKKDEFEKGKGRRKTITCMKPEHSEAIKPAMKLAPTSGRGVRGEGSS
jgi:hypothetical protein